MCGIGFCGGGITTASSGGSTLETSTGLVNGRLITNVLLNGLSLAQVRQYFRIYIDGTELATAEATTLDSDGVLDIGSNVMNGATYYLTKIGNP